MHRILYFLTCLGMTSNPLSKATAQEGKPRVPVGVRHDEDFVYCTPDKGKPLLIDVARPTVGKGPFPTVVLIPGGGWLTRGRKFQTTFQLNLAARGYVVASIDYRGSPESAFPTQLIDARTALRWLKSNAPRFDIDTQRLAAIGYSAGGNVASLLGLTRPGDGLAPDPDKDQGAGLALVVSCHGISDFASLYDKHCLAEPATLQRKYVRFVLDTFLGGPPAQFAEAYRRASAINYVHKDAPPMLLIHGTEDPVVPPSQSRLLRDRLKGVGVPVQLEEVKGGGHEFAGSHAETANKLIVRFLDDHFKPRR